MTIGNRPDASPGQRAAEDDSVSAQGTYEDLLWMRAMAFPNVAVSWYRLGCHLRHAHRMAEACTVLQRALALDPTVPEFWAELALTLEAMGDDGAAREAWAHAAALDRSANDSASSGEAATGSTGAGQGPPVAEPTHEIDLRGESPCMECPDFNYYGCRRAEPCGRFVAWREATITRRGQTGNSTVR